MRSFVTKGRLIAATLFIILMVAAFLAGAHLGYNLGNLDGENRANGWWIDQKTHYYDSAEVRKKGVELASQAIGDRDGPFVWKDTYVFLMDLDGKMIAHPIKPELTQQDNVVQVKDTDGKPLFVAFIQVAGKKGSGWVDYRWPKPGEENLVAKSSCIYRVPGIPYFVGAGI